MSEFLATVLSTGAVVVAAALLLRGGVTISGVLGLCGTFAGAAFGAWLAVRNALRLEEHKRTEAMKRDLTRLVHAVFDINTRYGSFGAEGDVMPALIFNDFSAKTISLIDRHRTLLTDVRSTLTDPPFLVLEAIHDLLAAFSETEDELNRLRVLFANDPAGATRMFNMSHRFIRRAANNAVSTLGRPDLVLDERSGRQVSAPVA